jgi:hypothetical protein
MGQSFVDQMKKLEETIAHPRDTEEEEGERRRHNAGECGGAENGCGFCSGGG